MRNVLHNKTSALQTLGRNLAALIAKRDRSARDIAGKVYISNKTVSSMAKAAHSVQIGKAEAVALELGVPLWQLMCPAIPESRIGDREIHELIEHFVRADDDDRAHILRMAYLAAQSSGGRHAA